MDVPLIPRELLFGNPERVSPDLSPDGRHLAWLAPLDGVLNVWVRTVGSEDDRAITHDCGRGIQDFSFAEDGVHVLYVQDRDGDENWHVYRVPVAGGDPFDLTPVDGVQARIVAADPRHPGAILVGLNDRDEQLHDVYRIDLASGERTLEVRNEIGAVDWIADHDLNVRAALVPTPDGGFLVVHRPAGEEGWGELMTVAPEDSLSSGVLGFADDDRTLYVTSSAGANAGELRSIDTETGETATIAGDPAADVADVVFDPVSHRPQAAVFLKERQEVKVLDPTIGEDLELVAGLHHGDLHIVSRDRADRHWLVAHVQDEGPVVYHSFDREAKRPEFLFSARPKLKGLPLAPMKPVSWTARDGLTIHGYLTFPPGADPKNLPVVVNVHGGPWHRDVWGYHAEAQWLANRGYACLQPNFRGSTGYGKDFVNAGDREWGGKMQDDVTDGVKWLIDEGIADPDRVAIYGGSYGGYAVLAGLTKTPELYRCGVDVVGPSNLITFSKSIPPYWEPLRALFERRVGNVETEEDFLRERSPLFRIDRIRVPLLIVQGKNDPRVNREESLQIVEALRAADKEVEYIEFEDEGHGFARPENRLTFYAAAEKFLARHLGGRCEE